MTRDEPGAAQSTHGASLSLFGSFIEPLRQCRAVQVMPGHIIVDVLKELNNGRLCNSREVEVLLTSSHKVCAILGVNSIS